MGRGAFWGVIGESLDGVV